MNLTFSLRGEFKDLMRKEFLAGERAATLTMQQAATSLKALWRADIQSAGLGTKLANAVRSQAYPKGDVSLNASVMVWSKAPKITAAHESGALIKWKKGFWLAIPLPAAGKGKGGARLTPLEWEARRGLGLRFVYRKGRTAFLVADGRVNTKGLGVRSGSRRRWGRATVPIFVLVPQVRLKKRLTLAQIAQDEAARLPSLFVANWK
jgi:hypothetical protein